MRQQWLSRCGSSTGSRWVTVQLDSDIFSARKTFLLTLCNSSNIDHNIICIYNNRNSSRCVARCIRDHIMHTIPADRNFIVGQIKTVTIIWSCPIKNKLSCACSKSNAVWCTASNNIRSKRQSCISMCNKKTVTVMICLCLTGILNTDLIVVL